jgi:hypothetical protein
MTPMRFVLASLLAGLLLAGCGSGSAADGAGAPRSAGAASIVPADAALYLGVVTDSGSAAWKQVEELLGRVPDGDKLLSLVADELSGEQLDWEDDVRPALGDVSAIVLPKGSDDPIALTKPSLRAKLDALLSRADEPSATQTLEDGWVAIAEKQAMLDAYEHALDGPRLADDDEFAAAIDGLPEDALGAFFMRASALDLSGIEGAAGGGLPTSVTGGLQWLVASLTARDNGLAVDGTAKLDDAPASYEPDLLQRVPGGVVLAASFHGDADTYRKLTTDENLAPYLHEVEAVLGVTLQDVLGLVEGEGVVYVRPGLPIPEVTIAAEEEDGAKATATLDRIARKLGLQVETATVDGVETHAVRFESVRITWAVFDGTLLVSSGRNALADFRSDDAKLVDEEAFGRAADEVELGDRTAGLFYVDMRRVAELIDGIATLAEEDVPPELSRNLAPIESFAANANVDGGEVDLHGFLSVPDR